MAPTTPPCIAAPELWSAAGRFPSELLSNGCNLDRKNPRAKEDITHLPPAQLAADILKKEQRIAEIMSNIQTLLSKTQ